MVNWHKESIEISGSLDPNMKNRITYGIPGIKRAFIILPVVSAAKFVFSPGSRCSYVRAFTLT